MTAPSIDVWCRSTAQLTDTEVQTATACLSPDERARASRFRFPEDHRDYIAAHALLRALLSARYGGGPERWQFAADALGKPRVTGQPDEVAPGISLSHCRGLVACAAAASTLLGVDVEAIDRAVDVADIAQRHFSKTEAADVAAQDRAHQTVRFIELWTLKEAFAKATGLGLSQPLDTVTFDLSDTGKILVGGIANAREEWTFALYEPIHGYRLAVAVHAKAPPMVVTNVGEGFSAKPACLRTSR